MNVGDTVTATITVNSDTDTYTNMSGTIGGFTLSSLTKTNDTTYTAEFTITDGGTDVAAGDPIPVSLTVEDSAGNTSGAYTAAISQDSDAIDANRPTLDSVSPADDAIGIGATDNLILTFSEAVSVGTGNLTIKHSSDASDFESIPISDARITGWGGTTLTVNPTGTFADNTGYYVVFDDNAILDAGGNSVAPITGADEWNFSTPDNTNPTVSSVSVPADNTYTAGSTMDFTVNFDENIVMTGTSSTLGLTLDTGGLVQASYHFKTANSITYQYTVQTSNLDMNGISVGGITLNGDTIEDAAGNTANLTLNSVASTANVKVDAVDPGIAGVTVADGTYKVGDGVIITITATNNESGLTLSGKTFNGQTLTSITDNADGTYSATYTVVEGDPDIADAGSVSTSLIFTDAAGNTSSELTSVALSGESIDAHSPAISSVSITNSPMKVGDPVTVTITADEAGLSMVSGSVNGVTVTGFTDNGGGSYTATYTVAEGNTDRASGDSIPVSFVLSDAAGNNSAAYTTAVTQNNDAIDAHTPSAPGLALATDSGTDTGDGITNDMTVDVTGLEGGATWQYSLDNGSSWHTGSGTSFEVTAGETYGAGVIQVTQTDAAGNISGTGSIASSVTTDTTAPDITAVSGAAWDSGADTITLTGSDFSTLLESGENGTTDIKARLDWNDITWDIDGNDGTDVTFSVGDIASAKVTADDTLVITLNSGKAAALEGTSGYGNIMGNPADTLDISSGFFGDLAGNTSDFSTDNIAMTGQPTRYTSLAVVTGSGIFHDYNGNGQKDASESAITNLSTWLSGGSKTIEFDAAPDAPINLTGFGADDFLRIDVSGFLTQGDLFTPIVRNSRPYISSATTIPTTTPIITPTKWGSIISVKLQSSPKDLWGGSITKFLLSRTRTNANATAPGNLCASWSTIGNNLSIPLSANNVTFI